MSAIEIKVPDIGDFAEVTVIELMVKPGDTVTVSAHGRVRVLRMLQPGERRGPATEAATLYEEIEA